MGNDFKNYSLFNWNSNNTYPSGILARVRVRRGYQELFTPSRFSSACLVQVPELQTDAQISAYLNLFAFPSIKLGHGPDYVILLEKVNFNSFIIGPSFPKIRQRYKLTKLISNTIMFTILRDSSLHFIPGIQKVRFLATKLVAYLIPLANEINLQSASISLSSFMQVQKALIPKYNVLKAGTLDKDFDSKCDQLLVRSLGKPMSVQNFELGRRSCIFKTLRNKNITQSLKFVSLDVNEFHMEFDYALHEPFILTYGMEFQGYRYLIFVDHLHKTEGFLSLELLTQPFSFFTWIFLLISVMLVTLILSISGIQNPTFVVISLLLEKSVVDRELRNGKVVGLILFWLFCAYVLRLGYTSSMYSTLTSEPQIAVPGTLQEAIDWKDYPIIAEYQDAFHVTHRIAAEYSANGLSFSKLSEKLLEVTLLLDESAKQKGIYCSDVNNVTSQFYQIKSFVKREMVKGHFMYFSEKDRLLASDGLFEPVFCGLEKWANLARFVYIYQVPLRPNINNAVGFPEILALLSFGNHKIFMNNHPPVFSSLKGWRCEFDFSIFIANDILAGLIESGVYSFWTNMFGLMNSAKYLRKIGINILNKHNSWNYVSLASKYLLGYDAMGQRNNDRVNLTNTNGFANHSLTIVWMLWSVCLGVSVILYLIEVSFYKRAICYVFK
ncbi:unnamed protein product [Orchesella dallaii]|uniref:Uncharacterized protein n=1 Tax=Orchesella dallaii TaxID=48710 RepID=A0ABP1S244_9HEXA